MSKIYSYRYECEGDILDIIIDVDDYVIEILSENKDRIHFYSLDSFPEHLYHYIHNYLDLVLNSLIPLGDESEQYIIWMNFKRKVDMFLHIGNNI